LEIGMKRLALAALLLVFVQPMYAQQPKGISEYVRENYTRTTNRIKVRDGVHLHTIVYSPKDQSQKYPILLMRTPYGIGPYEEDKTRFSLGPNVHFPKEGYIFAYQDVRGRYMSEGVFDNMRPQLAKKGGPKDIDESTDTYDTIDYLVNKVPNNNGRVGQYGISYPGFYTSAGMINAHPALKASSPQAPISDWFFDDFYHHGALFLAHAFPFLSSFGQPRPEPTTKRPDVVNYGTLDGYRFFLNLGSLKNIDKKHFKGNIAYWNKLIEANTYNDYWKARNLLPHLKNVAPAVMTVGGWYDAEDLYGIFKTYQAVEKQNPGIFNVLVVGPWAHGAWSAPDSTKLGHIDFGSNTSAFFQQNIELPFFNHYLKDKGEHKLPEAYVFETGKNQWRKFDHWPPRETAAKTLYLDAKGKLSDAKPNGSSDAHDAFVSDPNKPVPFTERIVFGMAREYMTDDQRFASTRPDVLTYQTDVLKEDLTIAGSMLADLFVATSAGDADWVVKVIDVFPDGSSVSPTGKVMSGYQMHVRSEVIRGRFRNSYEKPEPFTPDEVARVKLELMDVLHTFKKGHRLMVQVHSTWFPLIDRNPQKYVPNIFQANEEDFISATHRVHRGGQHTSSIRVGVLPPTKKE
jgi:putative CocE/NonD family hydrolase